MRQIESIIIHCSATPADRDIGVAEIKKWHVQRGFEDIGYHFVIRRDGTLENGRQPDKVGAHCKGYNARSLGICLVGGVALKHGALVSECNFTEFQWNTLERLVKSLLVFYPDIKEIHGHNEFAKKDCPCFDVQEWVKNTGVLEHARNNY